MGASYEIYQTAPDNFTCIAGSQGGTERWSRLTLPRAVESLIKFARHVNHEEITRDNITFFTAEERVVVEWTPHKLGE